MLSLYIYSLLISYAVSLLGSVFSTKGLPWYFSQIRRPSWTPSGKIIGMVWTVLFGLIGIAGGMLWSLHPANAGTIIALFVANGLLNIGWSYVFFYKHKLNAAVVVCVLLEVSVLTIVFSAFPLSVWAGILLLPYAAWVLFATYLSFRIARMNKNVSQR
jgi:tryptophan-rich sensory protein